MDTLIRRGDIFLAELGNCENGEDEKTRPVVIIQNNIANKYSQKVIVADITSSIRKRELPTHIEISREDSGLEKDSLILLDKLITVDKSKLKKKIGILTDEIQRRISKALSISLDIWPYYNLKESEEVEKYRKKELEELEKYRKMMRPLVLTEGKTDVKLIKTAWEKLNPGIEIPFEIMASGLQYKDKERTGGAKELKITIEYNSPREERTIIGLFDNDREGNENFKGLRSDIFEAHDPKNHKRKHKHNNVWGMLLPVPEERKVFVTEDNIIQRYFVIEHYFSDNILKEYNMYGENILGSCVFEIKGNKDRFSRKVNRLDAKEFSNFSILFSEINEVIKKID